MFVLVSKIDSPKDNIFQCINILYIHFIFCYYNQVTQYTSNINIFKFQFLDNNLFFFFFLKNHKIK